MMRKRNALTPKLCEGILPVNKPPGKTSFSLVHAARKLSGIQKIGHTGTLDPFATGVMVLLIGRTFTRQAALLQEHDKEYEAILHLGVETTTFDPEGEITSTNPFIPSLSQVESTVSLFQGTLKQIPPMFSAKKVQGKKLYELARKGIEIERVPVDITIQTKLIEYSYPHVHLHIACTKGTYIRTIASDFGKKIGCGAYLKVLTRIRCGSYRLQDCIDGSELFMDYASIE